MLKFQRFISGKSVNESQKKKENRCPFSWLQKGFTYFEILTITKLRNYFCSLENIGTEKHIAENIRNFITAFHSGVFTYMCLCALTRRVKDILYPSLWDISFYFSWLQTNVFFLNVFSFSNFFLHLFVLSANLIVTDWRNFSVLKYLLKLYWKSIYGLHKKSPMVWNIPRVHFLPSG